MDPFNNQFVKYGQEVYTKIIEANSDKTTHTSNPNLAFGLGLCIGAIGGWIAIPVGLGIIGISTYNSKNKKD